MSDFLTSELSYGYFKPAYKDVPPILILDSIPGSGKTKAIADYINNSPQSSLFVFVTPFLKEIKTIQKLCPGKNFFEPFNGTQAHSKVSTFLKALAQRKNIVTTHALLLKLTREEVDTMNAQNYTLIIDEALECPKLLFTSAAEDSMFLHSWSEHPATGAKKEVCVTDKETLQVHWKSDLETKSINKFTKPSSTEYKIWHARNGELYREKEKTYIWLPNRNLFKNFNRIFILTYDFYNQLFRCCLDVYGFSYKYIKTKQKFREFEENELIICDELLDKPVSQNVQYIKSLVTIFEHPKLNQIGDDEFSLSNSWYNNINNRLLLGQIRKNVVNYFVNLGTAANTKNKITTQDFLWTCFIKYQRVISDKRTQHCFLNCNARAYNSFSKKKNLAYLCNRFPKPSFARFFRAKGITLDNEKYALQELLQWMFRSQLRLNRPIEIYIPSHRMRGILREWLEDQPAGTYYTPSYNIEQEPEDTTDYVDDWIDNIESDDESEGE